MGDNNYINIKYEYIIIITSVTVCRNFITRLRSVSDPLRGAMLPWGAYCITKGDLKAEPIRIKSERNRERSDNFDLVGCYIFKTDFFFEILTRR